MAHPIDKVLAKLWILSVRPDFWIWVVASEVLSPRIWGTEEALHCVSCAVKAKVETLNVVCENFATIWISKQFPKKIRIGNS
jgi:hypothetical protein